METLPFRILAIALLIVTVIADLDDFKMITRPDVQLVLGTLVVGIIIVFDAVTGFTLGLAVLVLYIRTHASILGIDLGFWTKSAKNTTGLTGTAYVTAANLADAQNNVFDDNNYSNDIKGIKDPYDKGVYGAQGLDSSMPGLAYAPVDNWIEE